MKIIGMIFILSLLFCGCGMEGNEKVMEQTKEPTAYVETAATEETTAPTETAIPTEPELFHPLIDPRDEDFVRVRDYIPGVQVELKYATSDNFTGQVIYEFEDVFLRYGTVMKLKAVSEELASQGLYLKIWDGFRPVSAQFKLWEVCPDPTYVANPNKGFSNHSRGYAVDLTLVDAGGREVQMPTEFDDFSRNADRDYSDCSPAAAENARLLETVMEKHGFQGYWGEWWHFNDTQKYDVEDCFDPGVISRQHILEESPLLESFVDSGSEILRIPAGESVTILGYAEGYAMAEYWGYRGNISMDAIQPTE